MKHVRRLFQWQTGSAGCEQRLFDAGAWLLTDQVVEEQEESVPSQRREQHWVGWRMGGGVSVAMFGWLYLLWLALVSSVQARA